MFYMMSKQEYAGDSISHWPPHFMFFYSQTDPATWGANLPDSPIFASNDTLEHLTRSWLLCNSGRTEGKIAEADLGKGRVLQITAAGSGDPCFL